MELQVSKVCPSQEDRGRVTVSVLMLTGCWRGREEGRERVVCSGDTPRLADEGEVTCRRAESDVRGLSLLLCGPPEQDWCSQ